MPTDRASPLGWQHRTERSKNNSLVSRTGVGGRAVAAIPINTKTEDIGGVYQQSGSEEE
jgi:hypothetical protein